MPLYFLYARKSTDTEDMQVLSIESQLAELREIAKREGIEIGREFVEKQSAKRPGRPVFNEMLSRIERGEASGILCWKIDRLSRNPVDSGRVSWLLQQGTIQSITTHERTFCPTDNVLVMSVEFGMANEYVRQLAANTSRGLRAKARLGHYPCNAPVGYLNNPRTKTIVVDKRRASIVRAAFELYAENKSRLEDVSRFLFESGIRTNAGRRLGNGGKPLTRDQIKRLLSNPFYYGHFRFKGEMYEGRHAPIVEKSLFDQVQKVLQLRGRPHKEPKNNAQALCGLLRCGECGMSVTAEVKFKYQKNGNVHRYVYYRCTKKKGSCSQPHIREERLVLQVNELLEEFTMSKTCADELLRLSAEDEKEAAAAAVSAIQALRAEIEEKSEKLARLTDLYVEQDIARHDYLERKAALMSDKRSEEEQIVKLERDAASWLEPLRNWISEAQTLDEIRKNSDLPSKKSSLQKISGSNPSLRDRLIEFNPIPPYASLREARQNFSVNQSCILWVHPIGFEPMTFRM